MNTDSLALDSLLRHSLRADSLQNDSLQTDPDDPNAEPFIPYKSDTGKWMRSKRDEMDDPRSKVLERIEQEN